ncbi:hypothetical protein C1H46_028624 [Malus baccata]|uniref:Uncharacterized protein n=1 Tax=Malus baccata TaxID=106549 RepID=A0A540LH63_MALBA|nr:hypothetical protein C1H46_028624 [Malus baccata]
MEEDGGEPPQLPRPTSSKAPISVPRLDPQYTCPESTVDPSEDDRTDSKPTLLNQTELFRALEVVERDSLAIADSFTSLFASLRLALSEVTSNSADHMHCFGEAAGRLQESGILLNALIISFCDSIDVGRLQFRVCGTYSCCNRSRKYLLKEVFPCVGTNLVMPCIDSRLYLSNAVLCRCWIKRRNEGRWQSSLAAVSLTVTLVRYICVFNSLCFCLPPYPPYRWQSLALKSRIHFILLYAVCSVGYQRAGG